MRGRVDGTGMSDAPAPPLNIDDLVRGLGGPNRVACQLGVGSSAVCNWVARDQLPLRHHLVVWRLAQDAGLAWRPPNSEGVELVPAPSGLAA